MKLNKLSSIITALTVTTMCSVLGIIKPADAANIRLFGLTENNTLVSFDPSNPTATTSFGVTGVDGTLLGIDFRPANGLLYGVTDTNRLYTIDTTSGAATLISTLSVPFNAGIQSGFDFNPVPDRLRLVGTNEQNLRVNVATGATIVDGTLAYDPTDPNAGADPNVTAAAYTNSFPGAPSPDRTTQLFGIDYKLDVLVLQNPPNNGTLKTIGSLGIDFGATGGFDIFSPSSEINTAFAVSGSNLYTINLATGAATTTGAVGSGNFNFIGLAATSVPEPGTIAALLSLGALGLLSRPRTKSPS